MREIPAREHQAWVSLAPEGVLGCMVQAAHLPGRRDDAKGCITS